MLERFSCKNICAPARLWERVRAVFSAILLLGTFGEAAFGADIQEYNGYSILFFSDYNILSHTLFESESSTFELLKEEWDEMHEEAERICNSNKKSAELSGSWKQFDSYHYLFICLGG